MRLASRICHLVITGLVLDVVNVVCQSDLDDGNGEHPQVSDPETASEASEGTGVSKTDAGTIGAEDDSHASCRVWADRGECSTNAVYMLKHCPKSCANLDGSSHSQGEHEDEEVCSADAMAAGACKAPAPGGQELGHADSGAEDDQVPSQESPAFSGNPDDEEHDNTPDDEEESHTPQGLADAKPHVELEDTQPVEDATPAAVDPMAHEQVSAEPSQLSEPGLVLPAKVHQEDAAKPKDARIQEDGQESLPPLQPSPKVEAMPHHTPAAGSAEFVEPPSAAASVAQPSANVMDTQSRQPVSVTIPQSSAEWKGTVIAVYSVASALAQWVSVLAAEGGAFVVQAVFAEPPLNTILALFVIFVAILSFFRSLPTGSGQHRPASGQSTAPPAQPRAAGDKAKADGEILALRAQFEALQRQQEQTAAELQRFMAESRFNLNKMSAGMSDMQKERSSADEEICESLKEIFEWIAGGGVSPLLTNGQSKPSPALDDNTLPCKPAGREDATGAAAGGVPQSELLERDVVGANADRSGPMFAPHQQGSGGVDSTRPSASNELVGGAAPGFPGAVCERNVAEAAWPESQDAPAAAQPLDSPQAQTAGVGGQIAPLQGNATAASMSVASLSAPETLAAAPTPGAVPPALPVPAAALPTQPPSGTPLDPQDATGAGNMRPQQQEILAASNPFGSRPQQQPIQASANPFGSRPQPQPIQAKSNPFGSRPQPQPIQAAANPFGGPR